jgi:hypothetical protein
MSRSFEAKSDRAHKKDTALAHVPAAAVVATKTAVALIL